MGLMFEKPYQDDPTTVSVARSAKSWMDDIRAYLVEQELSTELAEPVAGLMDLWGWSVETAVDQIRLLLKP